MTRVVAVGPTGDVGGGGGAPVPAAALAPPPAVTVAGVATARPLAFTGVAPPRPAAPPARPTPPRLGAVPAAPARAAAAPLVRAPARPSPGQSYQYELNNPPTPADLAVGADWWDIDAFDTPAPVVSAIHARGEHAICYVDVGGAEDWRPDDGSFPAPVLGDPISGWPEERYVDIRQLAVLGRIEGARFDVCKAKGFDAIDPDVLDAYWKQSGFPLTVQDQLRYNDMLAGLAHARGMLIALKGDPELAGQEVQTFDFSIDESCVQWSECDQLEPFIRAGKAVFDVEYGIAPATFCPPLLPLAIGIEKHADLDAWRATC